MKRFFIAVVLCGFSAVAGDKPSAADRLLLAQDKIEMLQAEVAKLRAVLNVFEAQVASMQNAKFEAVMKRAGCKSLDSEFKCTEAPVSAGPPPPPPTPKEN